MMSRRGDKVDGATCAIVAVFFAVALGWSVISAHLEASAFNRATGKNMTWVDALFTDLRVTGEAK